MQVWNLEITGDYELSTTGIYMQPGDAINIIVNVTGGGDAELYFSDAEALGLSSPTTFVAGTTTIGPFKQPCSVNFCAVAPGSQPCAISPSGPVMMVSEPIVVEIKEHGGCEQNIELNVGNYVAVHQRCKEGVYIGFKESTGTCPMGPCMVIPHGTFIYGPMTTAFEATYCCVKKGEKPCVPVQPELTLHTIIVTS
jgi:hypothetical protein